MTPIERRLRTSLLWIMGHMRSKFIATDKEGVGKYYFCVLCHSKSAPTMAGIIHKADCQYGIAQKALIDLDDADSARDSSVIP